MQHMTAGLKSRHEDENGKSSLHMTTAHVCGSGGREREIVATHDDGAHVRGMA